MASRTKPPSDCHPDKPRFTKNISSCKSCYYHGLYLQNKGTILARQKQDRKINPDKYKQLYRTRKARWPDKIKVWTRNERLRRYSMTEADYDDLLSKQDGKCAICGKAVPRSAFQIDHDHNTNMVRALLCHVCNTVLGYVERPWFDKWMENARDYINTYVNHPTQFKVIWDRKKYYYKKRRPIEIIPDPAALA